MRATHVSKLAVVLLGLGVGSAAAGPFLLPVVEQVVRDGADGIDSLDGLSDAALAPGGDHLYVAAAQDDALTVFARDSVSGSFVLVEVERDGVGGVDGLDGPRAVAVSPDGAHVYAAAQGDDAVVAFARNAATGELDFVAAYRNGIGGVAGLDDPLRLALSPDGAHLYVATLGLVAGGDETIVAFARNPATGELSPIQVLDGDGTAVILASPDGAHVYASDGFSLSAFVRDGSTGLLAPIGPVTTGGGAAAISPDGSLLYASDAGDGIAVFDRDALAGTLVKRAHLRRLLEGPLVDGFVDMTVSADGEYAYAVSGSGIVVVLRHDAATGMVSLRDRREPAMDDPGGFVLVHPSGSPVIVGGTDDGVGKVVMHHLEPRACDPGPRAGCAQPLLPGASKLVLKGPPAAKKNKVVWTWGRGPDTQIEAFGAVFTTTHHALCVYDASGAPQPVLDAVAPPGGICAFDGAGAKGCWDFFPDASNVVYYRYRDKARRDGLVGMLLRSGPESRAKLKAKGSGPTLASAPSPLALPVRVQLQNDAGSCWEAIYGTADANAGGFFRARSD